MGASNQGADSVEDPVTTAARERMLADQLERRGIDQPAVLEAMRRVPREHFVPPSLAARAYEDCAIGIGSGQTISQPFMVARMTQVLDIPGWMVRHPATTPSALDVGTGSGYQSAVLAAMGVRVTGIERDLELAQAAERRLREIGLEIEVVVGDGSEGYPPRAPYDVIVVAAAAPAIPSPLVAQLADDGSLVVPVGDREQQRLVLVTRAGARVEERWLDPCVFVPLVGSHGFGG